MAYPDCSAGRYCCIGDCIDEKRRSGEAEGKRKDLHSGEQLRTNSKQGRVYAVFCVKDLCTAQLRKLLGRPQLRRWRKEQRRTLAFRGEPKILRKQEAAGGLSGCALFEAEKEQQ